MLITREVATRMLNTCVNRFPELVKSGKLKVMKVGYKGRKYYDRNEVINLAKELGKMKEL